MFYKDIFVRIRTFKPNIKEKTINGYITNIKKISKNLFLTDEPSIKYFNDFDSIQEYIEDNINFPSLASKKNTISSILVLLRTYEKSGILKKDLISKYTIYHKNLCKKQNETYLDNKKNEKEDANWITLKDIDSKIDNLKNFIQEKQGTKRQYIDRIQQYLLLNLYTKIPPLRNDYASVKVVDKLPEPLDKNFNYIDRTTKSLTLCRYKTDKFYGIKTIPLKDEVFNLIEKWEDTKKKSYNIDHNFLLINTTNLLPMNRNSLTRYLNKIFYPKKISTTLLRKIYLSEKFPVTNTYREMEDTAYIMCHEFNTARKVYSKIIEK